MTNQKRAKKIKADTALQRKVGTGQVENRKIEAAQIVIEKNEVDFSAIAKPELSKIQSILNVAQHKGQHMSESSAIDDAALLESLKTPIMNLKANAATFQYQFISDLTGTVLLFLETIDKPDKKILQIVDVLHKTVLLALAYGMKGDGGTNGKALLNAFQALCAKYKPKT